MLNLKQLEGLRHCPDKRVALAVETALKEKELRYEAEHKLRELQEKLAEKESSKVVIKLHRDGWVEVCGPSTIGVKFAHVPELGVGREDEADEHAKSRLPWAFRDIYDSRIARDTCKGCLSREGYQLFLRKLEEIALIRQIEEDLQ